MNSLENCLGYCWKCSSVECSNHPKNYDEAMEHAKKVLCMNDDQLVVLRRMMNTKLRRGFFLLQFEDEVEFNDKDLEVMQYTLITISTIRREVK